VRRVLQKANALGLYKSPALVAEMARQRVQMLAGHAKPTTFRPGNTPWNKGLHYEAGGNSVATRFGKGVRPHTWVPVGSYRIVSDGILEQKTNDLAGPNHIRWKPVHRLVWENKVGPVPSGHAVVFRPGKKTNVLDEITVDRLECITRQQLMMRNSVHARMSPELAATVQLLGVLKRKIRETEDKGTTA
jgi:hypothetical protein